MATNVPNKVPFLREQRLFPQEAQALSVEIDRAYTDIASSVNNRSLGIYTSNQPTQNGDTWYLNGMSYSGFRKIYQISSATPIDHGINFENIFFFTDIRGIGFDGTNYYPIPYVSPVAVNNGMGLFVSPTQIQIVSVVGSPALVSGLIVLEWLSQA